MAAPRRRKVPDCPVSKDSETVFVSNEEMPPLNCDGKMDMSCRVRLLAVLLLQLKTDLVSIMMLLPFIWIRLIEFRFSVLLDGQLPLAMM